MVDMHMDSSAAATIDERQASLRAWGICGLLLLATMLMYMDRQALSQQKTEILAALNLNNTDYGRLELGFGLAFAVGGIVTGLIADRISPRWFYPIVLLGWSGVGFATGWVTNYWQLLVCRLLLGFFEAGHWPCALVTSQRLLSRRDRPLGNSILQSGASLGALATPIVVLLLVRTDAPESWRLPFRVIGAIGVFWVVGWLAVIRSKDLEVKPNAPESGPEDEGLKAATQDDLFAGGLSARRWTFARRLLALGVVVIMINWCWQYFRAWMPGMLRDQYGYSQREVQVFSIAYYLAADVGCLTIGFLVKWLTGRGFSVHGARMTTFLACALLTGLSVLAAYLPAGWLFLGVLLVIGFGSLGQFPVYYSFTQELSVSRMGRVTGTLSFLTWTATALVQEPIGRWLDRTHSYSEVTFLAGLMPMIGFLALLLLWNAPKPSKPVARVIDPEF
jgi:ACS family hexuronate transporter-like MFS transporter